MSRAPERQVRPYRMAGEPVRMLGSARIQRPDQPELRVHLLAVNQPDPARFAPAAKLCRGLCRALRGQGLASAGDTVVVYVGAPPLQPR